MIRRAVATEHSEQAAVVDYLHTQYPNVLFWSTPNGAQLAGNASRRAAKMNILKQEGFLPGVSDLIIFEPRGEYSALFLEMKRAVGGKASENQLWFLREVEPRGGFGAVAFGFDEAKDIVDNYLKGKQHD
jgi:hypothetical protein